MRKWATTAACFGCFAAIFCVFVNYSRGIFILRSLVTRKGGVESEISSLGKTNDGRDSSNLIRKLYLASNGVNLTSAKSNLHNYVDTVSFHQPRFNNSVFSVISVSTPLNADFNYVFYAPLTALAWKRIGFRTIVMVSGSQSDWQSHKVLNLVRTYMEILNCTIVYLDTESENRVMISQVSRLFAASFLQSQLRSDDWLVLSDADLWPLDQKMYQRKSDCEILSLNSDCCGSFLFNGISYKMLPMANVGASVATWLDVVGTRRSLPRSVEDILAYFQRQFGTVARSRVQKGENIGWYQDQRMLSILVSEWIDRNNRSLIQFVPRNVGEDRIDRAWWSANSIENKTDIHLLENAYNYKTWFRLTPVLRLMYGEESPAFHLCMKFFEDFVTSLREFDRQRAQ